MESLKADIKYNCDVSDAKYWGYFSICGLLLRYRDLYRSERGLKPWANIDRGEIAAWIEAKESRWPELEHEEFRDLKINGASCHPFDVDAVNRALKPEGLVYGAGFGMYMKPTFFLARLKSSGEKDGLTVHTCGPELVRDLLTAPAMLQGGTVFLRLEPLMVLLYYKFPELSSGSNPALAEAFAGYGIRDRGLMDETFERRLENLAERYADIILHHEIAEYRESVPEWKDILLAAGDRKNEHYLRALKDLIADTSESGPIKRTIDTRDRAALGLLVALMEGFHRLLFPEMKNAYAGFVKDGDWGGIEKVRKQGSARFAAERDRIVEMFKNSKDAGFSERLKEYISV